MKCLENSAGGGDNQELPSPFAWYLRDVLTDKKLYKVDKQIFHIGRTLGADITCRCPCVSRNHVTLTLRDDGVLLIKDEGSVNGTFINSRQVGGVGQLNHGDELGVGCSGRFASNMTRLPGGGEKPHLLFVFKVEKLSVVIDLTTDSQVCASSKALPTASTENELELNQHNTGTTNHNCATDKSKDLTIFSSSFSDGKCVASSNKNTIDNCILNKSRESFGPNRTTSSTSLSDIDAICDVSSDQKNTATNNKCSTNKITEDCLSPSGRDYPSPSSGNNIHVERNCVQEQSEAALDSPVSASLTNQGGSSTDNDNSRPAELGHTAQIMTNWKTEVNDDNDARSKSKDLACPETILSPTSNGATTLNSSSESDDIFGASSSKRNTTTNSKTINSTRPKTTISSRISSDDDCEASSNKMKTDNPISNKRPNKAASLNSSSESDNDVCGASSTKTNTTTNKNRKTKVFMRLKTTLPSNPPSDDKKKIENRISNERPNKAAFLNSSSESADDICESSSDDKREASSNKKKVENNHISNARPNKATLFNWSSETDDDILCEASSNKRNTTTNNKIEVLTCSEPTLSSNPSSDNEREASSNKKKTENRISHERPNKATLFNSSSESDDDILCETSSNKRNTTTNNKNKKSRSKRTSSLNRSSDDDCSSNKKKKIDNRISSARKESSRPNRTTTSPSSSSEGDDVNTTANKIEDSVHLKTTISTNRSSHHKSEASSNKNRNDTNIANENEDSNHQSDFYCEAFDSLIQQLDQVGSDDVTDVSAVTRTSQLAQEEACRDPLPSSSHPNVDEPNAVNGDTLSAVTNQTKAIEATDSTTVQVKTEVNKEAPPVKQESRAKYSVEADCIVVLDSSDEDADFPCSQIWQETKTVPNDPFWNVKKELADIHFTNSDIDLTDRSPNPIDSDPERELIDILEGSDSPVKNPCLRVRNVEMMTEPGEKLMGWKTKYVTPPVIEAPYFYPKRQKQAKPPSASRKEKAQTRPSRKRKASPVQLNSAQKKNINTIRKEKLREVAEKQAALKPPPEKKAKSTPKLSQVTGNEASVKIPPEKKAMGTAKVKVSDSRGAFLVDAPSTSSKTLPKKNVSKLPPKVPQARQPLPSGTDLYYPPPLNSVPGCVISELPADNPLNTSRIETRTLNGYYGLADIIHEMLQWPPNWFEERKNMISDPPINEGKLVHLPLIYSTYKAYYALNKPLLMAELWNSMHSSYHEKKPSRTFLAIVTLESKKRDYKVLNCKTFIKQSQNQTKDFVKEQDVLCLQVYYRDERGRLSVQDLLGFTMNVAKKPVYSSDFYHQQVADAFAKHSPSHSVSFAVQVKLIPGAVVIFKPIQMRIVTSLVPDLRIFKSLKHLDRSPLKKFILKPVAEDYRVSVHENIYFPSLGGLNRCQKMAVMEAVTLLRRDNPGIYLIEGPPGTGKSTVILRIIQEILSNSHESRKPYLLLVAPSNAAVDEIATRFLNWRSTLSKEERNNFRLVRMGPYKMVADKVKAVSLAELTDKNVCHDICKNDKALRDEIAELEQRLNSAHKEFTHCTSQNKKVAMGKSLSTAKIELNNRRAMIRKEAPRDVVRIVENQIIEKASIICTTLSSCISARMEEFFATASNKITGCIVDEATQGSEQETLIPLMLGVTKLIMVGDPQQLPATTLSKDAKEHGYGKSLFSRVKKRIGLSSNNPIRLLNTQYRMHPKICHLPNAMYYGGKLINSTEVLSRKSCMDTLQPYLIFSVAASFSLSQEYANRAEADCVIRLLKAVLDLITNQKDLKSCSIGIVTPYNNQKGGISHRLKDINVPQNVSVCVNTVDSFQGQEKDIMIMSCVRVSTNNFLSDRQRLNVAMTRAKHALYIVGAESLFECSDIFGTIKTDAKKRHVYNKINANIDKKQLVKMIEKHKPD